jgi:glucose/arabinose dehydrogenase
MGSLDRRPRGSLLLVALTTAALLVAAPILTASTTPALARGAALELDEVGTFDQPVGVVTAPNKRHLLFVVEKGGSIAVLRDGQPVNHDFLDLRDRVTTFREDGLLALAFDPHYDTNRRFYVYYDNPHGDIELDEFKRSDSPTRATPGSRRVVIVIDKYQAGCDCTPPHHNGGGPVFGPDGHLYLATGDGGVQRDPENDAQRTDSLLGKILRIDPRQRGGYSIPRSNPFVGRPGRNEIISLGLRNPWRFSFDRESGDLWIGDVGFDSYEEIDHVTKHDAKGANFGWNQFEGPDPGPGGGTEPPDYEPPFFSYQHTGGNCEEYGGCAVTGGYVVRDPSLTLLDGRYIYADFFKGDIRSLLPVSGGLVVDQSTGLRVGQLSSFGEGRSGRLYAASLGGPVYRIVQAG